MKTTYEIWAGNHLWDSGLTKDEALTRHIQLEELCPTLGFDVIEVQRRVVNEEVLGV